MSEPQKPEEKAVGSEGGEDQDQNSRRDFLRKLGRWSAIIIGGAALAGAIATPEAEAGGWVNGRGGGGTAAWVNGGGGGGAGWVNRSGGGGAAWVNKSGGWINGAIVGGGGGGAAWVNTRGGWINRF